MAKNRIISYQHQPKKLEKTKKNSFYLQDLKVRCNFAPVKSRNGILQMPKETPLRKDGRVVDYTGLENRRAERHRGFESLSFRKIRVTSCKSASYPIFLKLSGRHRDDNFF